VGNNKILVNGFSDSNDLEQNIKVAKLISDILKKDVYIRP